MEYHIWLGLQIMHIMVDRHESQWCEISNKLSNGAQHFTSNTENNVENYKTYIGSPMNMSSFDDDATFSTPVEEDGDRKRARQVILG